MDDMDEILGEFLAESFDNTERLDEALAALSMASIPAILRTLHTIKGTAGFFSLNRLEALAHRGEALLVKVRDTDLPLDDEEVGAAIIELVATVRRVLEHVQAAGADGSVDIDATMQKLDRLLQRRTPRMIGRLLVGGQSASAADLFEAFDTVARAAADAAADHGAPVPRLGDLLVARGLVADGDVDRAIEAQRAGDPRHLGEILVSSGVVGAAAVFDVLNAQSTARSGPYDTAVRVDVGLLDELLDVVTSLAEVCDEGGHHPRSHQLLTLTGKLQQGLMRARMQPIGAVFEKVPRAVRTLESLCGKEVSVEVHGAQLELDRTVIEAVKGPLTHLVRNAVDHGIESPAERELSGKPRAGVLTLRAFEDDALAHVQVSDDGRGIDARKLVQRAVALGIMNEQAAARLSDEAAIELLFAEGLSTASQVSTVSGRGVGMDVVRRSVEQLSGTVSVTSSVRQGTTFTLSFPPSLAMVPALVVTDRDSTFVIPRRSIVEVFALSEAEREGAVLGWRDGVLPLVRASGGRELRRRDVVVVVAADDAYLGVLVDDVVDAQDIVLKPRSGGRRERVAVIADGTLARVIDTASLPLLQATEVKA